ncbi:hypothetical protein E2C01_080892 [Portunus trituberculatus]|uniref:Uncharacterized protein n=1 Tax=Portunus trituberculatus TaxID=210409 RepID=A0A5B7IV73_PORTR|nr:hypothetical protein [Portunus trituberculatus]
MNRRGSMEAEDSNLSIMTGDSEAEQQGREGISVIKDGKYSDLTITLADCNVSYKVSVDLFNLT